jgi:hypothetical protein
MTSLFETLCSNTITSGLLFIIRSGTVEVSTKKIKLAVWLQKNKYSEEYRKWDFAQKYASIEMMKPGGILTLSGLSGYLYYPSGKNSMFLGFKLMITMVLF